MSTADPDPFLFQLAKDIEIARINECYGNWGMGQLKREQIERVERRNYYHAPQAGMDIGLAAAKALLKKYRITVKEGTLGDS